VDPERHPLIIHRSCIPGHVRSTDVVVTSEATSAAGGKAAEEGTPREESAGGEETSTKTVTEGLAVSDDSRLEGEVEAESSRGGEKVVAHGGASSVGQVDDFLEGRMPLVYFELMMLLGAAASVPVMVWRKRKYMRY
jgi:hypothetical protein